MYNVFIVIIFFSPSNQLSVNELRRQYFCVCFAVHFSFSDYLLATMVGFCVVVIAVCCVVTGSCGYIESAGRYTRLVAGIYPVGGRYSPHVVGRYNQLVTGIEGCW